MHTYLFFAHSPQPVVALKYPVCINIQESVASKNFHENWHKRAQQRPRMLQLTREEIHFSMRGWKREEARGWNTGEMMHNTMWLIADKQYGWKINLFISERCPLSHAPLGRYENDDASDSPLKRGVIWFHRRNKRKTIWCNLASSRAGQLLVRVHTCDVWVMERAALNAALSWIISLNTFTQQELHTE